MIYVNNLILETGETFLGSEGLTGVVDVEVKYNSNKKQVDEKSMIVRFSILSNSIKAPKGDIIVERVYEDIIDFNKYIKYPKITPSGKKEVKAELVAKLPIDNLLFQEAINNNLKDLMDKVNNDYNQRNGEGFEYPTTKESRSKESRSKEFKDEILLNKTYPKLYTNRVFKYESKEDLMNCGRLRYELTLKN